MIVQFKALGNYLEVWGGVRQGGDGIRQTWSQWWVTLGKLLILSELIFLFVE